MSLIRVTRLWQAEAVYVCITWIVKQWLPQPVAVTTTTTTTPLHPDSDNTAFTSDDHSAAGEGQADQAGEGDSGRACHHWVVFPSQFPIPQSQHPHDEKNLRKKDKISDVLIRKGRGRKGKIGPMVMVPRTLEEAPLRRMDRRALNALRKRRADKASPDRNNLILPEHFSSTWLASSPSSQSSSQGRAWQRWWCGESSGRSTSLLDCSSSVSLDQTLQILTESLLSRTYPDRCRCQHLSLQLGARV